MGYTYFKRKNHDKSGRQKPTRDQLWGMSPSQFKTFLKKRGVKVQREFFKNGCIAEYKHRMLRFRWWSGVGEFFVDISCPKSEFDRWANSVENTINFYNWIEK